MQPFNKLLPEVVLNLNYEMYLMVKPSQLLFLDLHATQVEDIYISSLKKEILLLTHLVNLNLLSILMILTATYLIRQVLGIGLYLLLFICTKVSVILGSYEHMGGTPLIMGLI